MAVALLLSPRPARVWNSKTDITVGSSGPAQTHGSPPGSKSWADGRHDPGSLCRLSRAGAVLKQSEFWGKAADGVAAGSRRCPASPKPGWLARSIHATQVQSPENRKHLGVRAPPRVRRPGSGSQFCRLYGAVCRYALVSPSRTMYLSYRLLGGFSRLSQLGRQNDSQQRGQ